MQTLSKIINFKSFTDMLSKLPDDMACREYLEGIVWNGIPTCPHCKYKHSYMLKTKGIFKGMYKCKACQKRYTVTMGTMFEGTHIGLRKWFIAIYIFSMHKKGISSHQLASDLGITQKTAWYMLQRIRHAFKDNTVTENAKSVYEVDATYIGGKVKNKHAWERKKITVERGRGTGNKVAVLGILERDGGVTTQIVKSEASTEVTHVIEGIKGLQGKVVTDAASGYKFLSNHIVVNHQQGEFVNGIYHTNNIEGFWSQMKRGLYGVYHHCSVKHLPKYCNEFAYRYNVRKKTVNEKFNYSLLHSERLKYAVLIGKQALS